MFNVGFNLNTKWASYKICYVFQSISKANWSGLIRPESNTCVDHLRSIPHDNPDLCVAASSYHLVNLLYQNKNPAHPIDPGPSVYDPHVLAPLRPQTWPNLGQTLPKKTFFWYKKVGFVFPLKKKVLHNEHDSRSLIRKMNVDHHGNHGIIHCSSLPLSIKANLVSSNQNAKLCLYECMQGSERMKYASQLRHSREKMHLCGLIVQFIWYWMTRHKGKTTEFHMLYVLLDSRWPSPNSTTYKPPNCSNVYYCRHTICTFQLQFLKLS